DTYVRRLRLDSFPYSFIIIHYNLHLLLFFFLNKSATTEIYTLSLHDALPISRENIHGQRLVSRAGSRGSQSAWLAHVVIRDSGLDRKSTRLNSSHVSISYAVFCLKKKKFINRTHYYSLALSFFTFPSPI